MAVAHELGFEAECVQSRSTDHPYLVLKVPETLSQDKRVCGWLTVYYAGVEAEKALYGSYTGDGTGEIGDLAHEFHLDETNFHQGFHTAKTQQNTKNCKQLEAEKMADEPRDNAAQAANNEEAAHNLPYPLFFFRAIDREGVTRFIDVMKHEDGFTVGETATGAPRLGQCVETVYEGPGGVTHHVYRNYGKYRTSAARQAMEHFAFNRLSQVTEMAKTLNISQALPTWKLIFEELGCPTVTAKPSS